MSSRRRPRDENNVSYHATKRPRYDYMHKRDYVSLPQQEVFHHKYYLRPYEHRRPIEMYGCGGHNEPVCRRNAHSYSLNGHRCSNSSTASSRKRKLEGLKLHTGAGSSNRKQTTRYEESVSY